MDITKNSTTRKSLTLATTLMIALLLALPATGFSWSLGKGQCFSDRFEQRAEEVKENLNLDETQTKLWNDMKAKMIELRELSLKQGDNLDSDTRRRTMARNHLLMRAELAAEAPDFKDVGDKLKAEYKGNLAEKFNKVTDARVAFFSSLSQEQRDTMLKKSPRGARHKGKGSRAKKGVMR
ncbi:MAG: Spy/CpxP family protein refolding chaperone [Deltaproteobacteria bacterium]|nr:Spy/CpxP family protein refolding chaperone [Candidatus Tharpella sp.]